MTGRPRARLNRLDGVVVGGVLHREQHAVVRFGERVNLAFAKERE